MLYIAEYMYIYLKVGHIGRLNLLLSHKKKCCRKAKDQDFLVGIHKNKGMLSKKQACNLEIKQITAWVKQVECGLA